jgi:hypothetical protein
MLFAATHPEIVDKMIIADIGPKFYIRSTINLFWQV